MGCQDPGEGSGEFRLDKDMIEFFNTNFDEFSELVDTKDLCNEPFSKFEKENYPEYCKEIKEKLEILRIEYSVEDGEGAYPVYHENRELIDRFHKGYAYYENPIDSWNIWDGDLNTIPSDSDNDCENYTRLIEIDDPIDNKGWFLYAYVRTFCD